MKELDLLKKDWKKSEASFEQLSEKDIYVMLHKKSSSIVKWILIISILEVLLWSALSFVSNTDAYLKKINHEEFIGYFRIFNFFHYGVILIFIYLFYKNFVSISTLVSTKQLMRDILKTRKTVQYYVWYNLAMIALSFIIGFIIALAYNPEVTSLKDGKLLALLIGIILICVVAIVGMFWFIYKILYGILLRKLQTNYKELKKIDL